MSIIKFMSTESILQQKKGIYTVTPLQDSPKRMNVQSKSSATGKTKLVGTIDLLYVPDNTKVHISQTTTALYSTDSKYSSSSTENLFFDKNQKA